MAETKSATCNGLSVDQIYQTVDAIKARPEIARFQFRNRNRWLGGGLNRSTIQDFYGGGQEDSSRAKPFVFDNDEPPVLLGENRGANPVEFVLHALAGCLTTSMVLHAAARGIHLEEVESRFEGDLDVRGLLGLSDEVRNGYERIRVAFKVKGDAPPETLEELVRLAQARSPVFDIVSHGVPVEVRLDR
ncbi:MAG TPA: OsmC family protein [Vicinamibacteria bacterium]|nr:OsmC family protein [Vicinamibacteria bacterium]